MSDVLHVAAFVLVCLACMWVPREPEPIHGPDPTYRTFQYGEYDCWQINGGPARCHNNPPGYPINAGVSLDELKRGARP